MEFNVQSHKRELETKAEEEEVLKINGRLDEMPTRKEVKQVRLDLFGSMDRFSNYNEEFKVEFLKQSEMIARYDEVMCQKCSV